MSQGLLTRAPTQQDLERLYFELARRGAPSVGRRAAWVYAPKDAEELLALAAEMLRYDARLLTILLQWLLTAWRTLNPRRIRGEMERTRWPQALLVVGEFARETRPEAELKYFLDYIAAGWRAVDPAERFFLGGFAPESKTEQRRLGRSLRAYSRWGYLGTERPQCDVHRKVRVGRYDARTRRDIAHELAQSVRSFALAEYLDAIDHAVNRQQALADLRSIPGLGLSGHGRGARWSLRPVRHGRLSTSHARIADV